MLVLAHFLQIWTIGKRAEAVLQIFRRVAFDVTEGVLKIEIQLVMVRRTNLWLDG
jgi:hypothetical protein